MSKLKTNYVGDLSHDHNIFCYTLYYEYFVLYHYNSIYKLKIECDMNEIFMFEI